MRTATRGRRLSRQSAANPIQFRRLESIGNFDFAFCRRCCLLVRLVSNHTAGLGLHKPFFARHTATFGATMFILSTLSDTIFIPSSSFTRVDPSSSASSSAQIAPTSLSSLSQALNAKYANRVIPDVGLCICLFDVLEASEGRVKWGDGGLWHKCRFRLAVFRPFVGEVLVGKVMSSDEGGIRGELASDDIVKRIWHKGR